ncbi:MAG: hypothetical protein EBS01_02920 [Verrucomicrobia bacterium]|nr:hypothetical protein [Verrucomicrobiota bacterium]
MPLAEMDFGSQCHWFHPVRPSRFVEQGVSRMDEVGQRALALRLRTFKDGFSSTHTNADGRAFKLRVAKQAVASVGKGVPEPVPVVFL